MSGKRQSSEPEIIQLARIVAPRSPRTHLLALFIAHFDESGTHGKSPYTVLGGYVATAGQWELFDLEWKRLLGSYGVASFHSTEFTACKKQFEGWNRKKQRQFERDVTSILDTTTLFSIATGVVNKDHDDFKKNPGIKHYHSSHYGLCFHYCMANTVKVIARRHPHEQVTFVLEAGHRNARDAAHIFNVAKNGKLNRAGTPTMLAYNLGSLVFQSGLSSLEAADFLAYRAYQDMLSGKFRNNARLPHGYRLFVDKKFFRVMRPALVGVKEKMQQYAKSRLKSAQVPIAENENPSE